jgi:hypothetical protein
MTFAAWIFLILSWGIIIYLTVYCFVRILAVTKKEDKKKIDETGS